MTDFKWRHFQGDVILWAVRWYCRYPISYRDLEEMLAERGISVDHTTIYRWVQCYAPEMEKRLRWFWRRGFDPSWRLDETYVKVRGKWTYLYRAVDKRGDTIDFGTVAKLAMRQPFVLFKGLTFQKLCLPGAFRPGDHHNKMLRPGLCVVHASPQYL
ncbi:IS6 family transposase [Klebsiella quasipneumoniae]|nr:IS6 family transposase [Klebsiella pneumoniae]